MKVVRIIKKTCTDCKACSDTIIAALGHNGASRKLKAMTAVEATHGHVTIDHTAGAHIVEVEFYEQAEGRKAVELTCPTKKNLESLIDGCKDA